MLDWMIETLSLGLFLVSLAGLAALIKPYWKFKRRWRSAAVFFAGCLGVGLLQGIPPERPANISPAAWAARVKTCEAAHAGRTCPKDDQRLAEAQKALADAVKPKPSTQSGAEPSISDLKYADRDGVARKITQTATRPYTRKDDPDIFHAWGEAGVKRIEALRGRAAEAAAASPQCDQVSSVELADRRSHAPNHPVVFADCVNAARFYIDEAALKGGIRSEADREVEVSDMRFFMLCSDKVQAMMRFPSTFEAELFSKGTVKTDASDYGVGFDFTVKNSFGAKLPYHAQCILRPHGKLAIKIGPR